MPAIRRTPGGFALVNLGCGRRYSPEWNNLDLEPNEHVERWDARRGLPYPDRSMDGVYASHVLEHFQLADAHRVVAECHRILKPGGVLRLVVPDLERLCRDYLDALDHARPATDASRLRHEWAVTSLIDQLVRERSGGHMGTLLDARRFDPEWLERAFGDEFAAYTRPSLAASEKPAPRRRRTFGAWMRRRWQQVRATFCPCSDHPQQTGEAHRWMWDRFSLSELLDQHGFTQTRIASWDQSRLPEWHRYQLDRSQTGERPAKPDSLYVEGLRP